jgi:hypothetical protein
MGFPSYTQPLILTAIIAFGLYMAHEVWRWGSGNRAMLTPGQFRRRLAGGIILEADLLLWFLANPLMSGRPPEYRLLYLLTACLLVMVPMILAVREVAFIIRQYVRWRGELARNLGKADVDGNP